MQSLLNKAKAIRLAIFDVDGVLTAGQLFYTDNGEQLKAFHVHDGVGLKLLQKSGIPIAIITSHDTPLIQTRMAALEIDHLYQGYFDKRPAYDDLRAKLQLEHEQICYVGDDLPDLPLIRRVGLGVAVANANAFVKQHADWQTRQPGGNGAVREVCELIMTAQNTLAPLQQAYLD